MARDNSPLGPSAKHIAREYTRARKQGVTQKEFARNAGLTSDRYLRKILAGERSGRILEQRAQTGGSFTVPLDYRGSEASINIRLPARVSRIDIYQPRVQRAIKREVTAAQHEERIKSADAYGRSPLGKARLRGKVRTSRLRYARTIHKMPVVVLP